MYSPDPYVTVQVHGTPNGIKRTPHVKDESNPEWNCVFEFFLDVYRDRVVEFVLFDLNRTVNEEIGREVLDLSTLPKNQTNNVEIQFRNGSRIEVTLEITRK